MTLTKPTNLLIMAAMVLAMAFTFSCSEDPDEDDPSSASAGDGSSSSVVAGGGNSSSSGPGGGSSSSGNAADPSSNSRDDEVLGSCMTTFEGNTKGCLEYALELDADDAEEMCADRDSEFQLGSACPEGYEESGEWDEGVTAYYYPPEPKEPPEDLPLLGSCRITYMQNSCIEYLESYEDAYEAESSCDMSYGQWSDDSGCPEGYGDFDERDDVRIYYYSFDDDDEEDDEEGEG